MRECISGMAKICFFGGVFFERGGGIFLGRGKRSWQILGVWLGVWAVVEKSNWPKITIYDTFFSSSVISSLLFPSVENFVWTSEISWSAINNTTTWKDQGFALACEFANTTNARTRTATTITTTICAKRAVNQYPVSTECRTSANKIGRYRHLGFRMFPMFQVLITLTH